jgi:hypothetical protein
LSFQCRTFVTALSDACVLLALGCIIQFWFYAPAVPESFLCCSLCACTCHTDNPYFCPLTSYACYTFGTMGSTFHKQARAWAPTNIQHLEFWGVW